MQRVAEAAAAEQQQSCAVVLTGTVQYTRHERRRKY